MTQAGWRLTEAQEGLWYAQALDPANPIFNTGQFITLNGPLALDHFRAAVNQASAEAEVLALRFSQADGEPRQWLDPAGAPQLEFLDLSGNPAADDEARAMIAGQIAAPSDLASGPIALQRLYRVTPERHIWALQAHHMANDGFGIVMLTKRVAELYSALCEGSEKSGRPFAPLADLLAEDADYRTSAKRADDAAWWRASLAAMPETIAMKPGRATSAHTFLRRAMPMPQRAREAVATLAKAAGVSWPDTLTALVAAYCARFVEGGEVVIGMPHMGRFGSKAARIPGMVMNVLPLIVRTDDEAPLAQWVQGQAASMREARRHGRYRSEHLRRDLGLIGGARRLYGPLVNVQPYDKLPRFADLQAELTVTGTGPVDDIHFTFRGDLGDAITLEVDANPDLYDEQEIADHAERLAEFLAAAGEADCLAAIPTATPAEAHRELEQFNRTARNIPETSLAALIAKTMKSQPEAEALRFEGESLTYAQLDQRSAALAQALRSRGVGAETIVAVSLPRSLELVVALLGVIRAGGAYLPLDLDHPPARIATILESAAPLVVLADNDPHSLYGEKLLRPEDWPLDGAGDLPLPDPDHAAYVIYTSGSTGAPKGVVISHRAIVNRLLWMGTHYAFGPADRILQKTPATFDVSVWEFFLAFVTGGTLVVAPPDAHRDPAAIARIIREEAITTLHFVPSMLAAFCAAPASEGLALTRVFCSGEALPADLRDRFHRRIEAQLHNLYGPTEAAVDVSYWDAGATDRSDPVPIGWPVWNTRLVILDRFLRPVSPGQTGELFLGGVQLARGYLGRPDLTAERFIADPFHPGKRLYRTGDVARRRGDGAVEFLGRSDHQVKLRGLRIELGEIEAAMAQNGLVASAHVQVHEQHIVGYVVPEALYSRQELLDALAARLPAYMVPAALIELEAMPVTANGKLDRKALPLPQFGSAGGAAPQGETEIALARLYREVLGLETEVSREDDFFALGGDSLSAIILLQEIAGAFGRDPGLGVLFETSDIAGLAQAIEADDGIRNEGLAACITLARGQEQRAPLFLIHPAGGICWGYRRLAHALGDGRQVYGLQARGLDLAEPLPASIDAMARVYAAQVQEQAPVGIVHLGGWSVGGMLAQAVAEQLQTAGREVGLVAMLDSYPAECWRNEPEPTAAEALRALLAIAGYDPEGHPELDTRVKVVDFLRSGTSALGNLPPAVQDGVIRVVLDTNRLVRAHHHRRYLGTLTHVRAAKDHQDRPDLAASLWRAHCAALEEIAVPFLHKDLPGAAASALIGPMLAERMAKLERVTA
ncbi:amino acid adenylation domain-containing protein [Aurantiacibacter flavus]|uniref:Amino acid adenylation domain-containing protein n=1 Tax=Aurantiacibacter flavus TaxID=3145232 RepID=A0ABV0CYY6_9SPHN